MSCRILSLLLLLLTSALVGEACGAESSATEWLDLIKQARRSDGFEARMSVTVTKPNGQRNLPIKLSVIGQIRSDQQRFKIRGISPELVRNHFVEVSQYADGRIGVVAYEPSSTDEKNLDPLARLYDSGLVAWDMLAPWWGWQKQAVGEVNANDGRECTVVLSKSETGTIGIAEAVSCISRDARLALTTELLDDHRKLVRTLKVERMMRKDSGAMAAKRVVITEANGTITEIEIYSGDEHYQMGADAFARSDARAMNRKQR